MELIKEFLVLVPGIALTAFSLYFVYQKLGNNILITYSIVSNTSSEERITKLTLINKKNKPVTIFSIQAVMNKDIIIEVEKFEPAIVLKPLESLYVDTKEFSYLHINGDRYRANYVQTENIDIYLITEKQKIKCTLISSPLLSQYFDFKHYTNATKGTMRYNGKVYNEGTKYILFYLQNKKEKTAFIHESGYIGEDWSLPYNRIPPAQMSSKEGVMEFIKECGYDKLINILVLDEK